MLDQVAELSSCYLSDSALRFTTARIDCEPLTPAHAQALHAGFADAALYRYVPAEPTTLEALHKDYARLASRRSPDGKDLWLNWALRLRASDAYVGTLQATLFPRQSAYLAYYVFTPYQRRGLAHEACTGLLAFLAAHSVREVTADIDTRNTASIALVESLGFVRIRETKAADFFKGATSDEYRYRRDLLADVQR